MNTALFPFTLHPVFSVWLILLLFGLGAGLTFVQYRRIQDKLGRNRALTVSALRLCAISLIILFALNPSFFTVKEHPISPVIAVVLDTADSMGQSDPGKKTTRLDDAKALLTTGNRPLLKTLSETYEVNLYALTDSLKPLAADDWGQLKAAGRKGDVNRMIEELSGRHSAALLFSDGNLKWNGNPSPSLPLITVAVGDADTYKDILIMGVKAPTQAFRGREIVIDLTIQGYGYSNVTLPVLLKDSEKLITAKNIHLEADTETKTLSFSFIPDTVGRKDVTLSIPRQAGESTTANNQVNLSINVMRDKTRILMVSGSPSMNYRFMRMALKSDPSLDLLSFVIMRTPSDILNVRNHEQSLIPFPVDTIFLEEIGNFDLILFDNFNYAFYLTPDHLGHIREFVKEGGGFGVIGGPGLFNEGRVGLSPIGDILPFRFVEQEFYKREAPFPVRLTRAGMEHPMMRIGDDLGEKETDPFRFWEDMPPLDGINSVEAKPSAAVLLESGDGIPRPVLTVSGYGKGRVLGLTTDYAWKWYMGMVAKGKGNRYYLRLVHGMVRWLTRDPSLEPIQIILPEAVASIGREIDIRVQFYGPDPTQGTDSAILFSVFDPEGGNMESTFKPTGTPGEYRLSFRPDTGGIHRIRVETPAGSVEEAMVVSGPLQRLDAAPNPAQLEKIAVSTGGRSVSQTDDLIKTVEAFTRKSEKVFVEEIRMPAWATPYVMAVILGLLSAEWYLRRRWGLI